MREMEEMAKSQTARSVDETLDTLGGNLRKRRRELGLTLQEVADGSNLSVGFISQLERNLTSPSLSSLAAIVRVLKSDFADFFAMPGGQFLTTRADRRSDFALDERVVRYERISSGFAGHKLDAVILHKQPGQRSEPTRHEGEELYFVISGSVTVELDKRAIVMNEGDTIHFRSNQSHAIWNHTSEVASILIVVTMDIFGDKQAEEAAQDSAPSEKRGSNPLEPSKE